ncbi:AI-2E family transporter [Pseudonocardia acaciae]|uniref:AI-2E family transporter n=1 Tax=Pseudonocardia acaciae TaxID=551276 RepID=UPI0009FC346E|nr:AI-2E family transporter [Pseudonocardia acaciae]
MSTDGAEPPDNQQQPARRTTEPTPTRQASSPTSVPSDAPPSTLTGAPQAAPDARPAAVAAGPLRVVSELCARFLVIAAALGVVIFLVIQLRVVVIPAAIALLLAALLAPLVGTTTQHLRLPRGLATGLVLIGGIALLSLVLSFVINAFIAGLPDLRTRLIQSFELNIKPLLSGPPLRLPPERLDDLPGELQRSLTANTDAITSGALSTAATVGEMASGLALVLFVLIFFLYDGKRVWGFLLLAFPVAQRRRADIAGQRAFASLVGYTRATVVVAVVDAVGIGIGLWVMRVPLVVPLAALVFLGAFVPVVGAVLSGSVAVLIALVANGPFTALIVLGVVIAVMQLESHVLQPILLGRAVQLHPLAVVLAVAGGVVISGIAGALLAVPLVAVISAGVRSLVTPAEPNPAEINPLDPRHAKAGPIEPRQRRRLVRVGAAASSGLKRGRRQD